MKDVLERVRRVAEKEAREVNDALPRARRAAATPLRGHTGSVARACVLAAGNGVVTACSDASIRVYSLSGGDPVHTLEMHEDWATGVAALSEDVIASVGCDGVVVTWEAQNGKLIEKLRIRDHDRNPTVVARAGSGKLVVGTGDGELHFLEHTAGRGLRYTTRLRRAHIQKIRALASHDGVVVAGSDDRCASVWEGRRCIARLAHNRSVRGVDINSDRVVTLMHDEVRVYERATWRLLRVLRGLHGYEDVTSVVLLNNDVLLSVGTDSRVLFTRITDATPLARYRVVVDRPEGVAVAPGGRLIVTSEWSHCATVLEVDGSHEAAVALRDFCNDRFKTPSRAPTWFSRALKPMLVAVGTMAIIIARRSRTQQ